MSQRPRGPATLVTGRIATLAGAAGPGWVDAVAIRNGRVVAAGSASQAAAAAGERPRVMALAPDEAAIPGLTDSHLHLVDAALARRTVQLEGSRSVDALVERVAAAAQHPAARDAWIEGGGWMADTLGAWPTAADLERVAPGRLVALWAHDHHALLASSRALADAGIHAGTADPAGGVIRRDARGEPTGVLHETASRLVADRVPAASEAVMARAVAALCAELVALGVVAVHDPGGLATSVGLGGGIAAYRALAASGGLPLRIHVSLRAEQLEAAIAERLRSGQPIGPDPLGRLHLGWLKAFADGSLGSRTAALIEPLAHIPGEAEPPNGGYGVWVTEPAELEAQASRAVEAGIATQIHGIGDAAVRAALDVLGPTVGKTPLMPRVEHAQLVAEADIARFGRLGIAASMQPVHVRSDASLARSVWGPRAEERGYALGRLLRAGAVVASGTDAPVEPVDPWPGVACAVARSAPEWGRGASPFGTGSALTLWESIRSWCLAPALAAGEPDRGRLLPGYRADLAVLPAAALTDPVEPGGALWNARPRLVLLDGEVAAGA